MEQARFCVYGKEGRSNRHTYYPWILPAFVARSSELLWIEGEAGKYRWRRHWISTRFAAKTSRRRHREGKIVMGPASSHFRLDHEAPHGRDRNHVAEHNQKSKTCDSSELRHLDKRQNVVQGDPETVP